MKVVWNKKGYQLLNELTIFLSEFIGVDKANQFQGELIQFTNEKLSNHPERNPPCRFPKLQEHGY